MRSVFWYRLGHAVVFFWDLEWRFTLGGLRFGSCTALEAVVIWNLDFRMAALWLFSVGYVFSSPGPVVKVFKKINIFQSILKQQNVTKHGKLEILKFSSNIQQEQRSNIWRKQPRLLSSKIRGSLDGARRNRWTEPHQPGKKSLITFHCTDCLTGIRDPYNGLAWFSKLPTQLGFSMST